MDTERLDPIGVTENVREPSPLTGNRGWDALLPVLLRTWLTGME
jgi:hypothetical protein